MSSVVYFRIPAKEDSMTEIPILEDFKKLSQNEQREIVAKWDPYDTSDGQFLRTQIDKEFEKEYGYICELEIHGISNCHGSLVIGVSRPFLFDTRLLPEYFLGFPVYVMVKDMPEDFAIYKDYIWAPENYENYVDLHEDEIRQKFADPNMTRREMFDLLCGKDFDEWIKQCRSWGETDKYK